MQNPWFWQWPRWLWHFPGMNVKLKDISRWPRRLFVAREQLQLRSSISSITSSTHIELPFRHPSLTDDQQQNPGILVHGPILYPLSKAHHVTHDVDHYFEL